MAIIESGDGSGLRQLVNANGQALVNLPTDPNQAGCARIVTVDGDAIDVTENNYLRVSTSNIILYEQVDGSAVNTNVWNPYNVSGMTITQTGGFITLNAGQSIATGAYAILQSIKNIPLYGTLPLTVEINAKVLNVPEANATVELGIGAAATNAAPTDGAFFRWTPAGGFYCVLNNGGNETVSANLASQTFTDTNGDTIMLPPSVNVIHLYSIEIVEDKVQFSIDDILAAEVSTPAGQAYPFNAGRQTVLFRVYNGGSSPSLFPQLAIGQVLVKQEDLNQQKPWATTLAELGRGAYQSPVTTFGQTANHANSASPASATLSNTAAGYTTLGGRFQFAAIAAAATDYALFAYQIPAGFQFHVNRISISTGVAGLAVVTATILDWFVAVNSSAVSLATVDGAGTWAPRRIPLGMQGFLALAGIGQMANDLVRTFETPIIIDGGRYLIIGLQVPNGAATATLVFRGDVTIDGFFE